MPELSNMTDSELLEKIQMDDHSAFGELYKRHWKSLYNSAFKRLPEEEVCKDIIQDVFADFWLRRNKVEIEKVGAYLYTAVRFQVLKYFSRNNVSVHFLQPLEDILDASLSADHKLKEKEFEILLESWMESQPEKRLAIYKMHIHEELSTAEIASRLSVSQKTVQNQLGTSFRSLRAKMTSILTFSFAFIFSTF